MKLPQVSRKGSYCIAATAILLASVYVATKFPAGDFAVYYSAGSSLLQGRTDLYSPNFANGPVMDFRYPPGSVLLFLPLALFSFPVSVFLFSALTLGLVFYTLRSYWTIFGGAFGGSAKSTVLVLSIVLCLKYFLMSMRVLNIHLIVVCLLTLAFVFLLRERTKLAAGSMALGVAIKVFPIISLPYFALRQQWKFLLLTAASLATFFALPSVYFGFQRNIELHREFVDHVLTPSPVMEVNRPPNQSVFGVLERLLTDMKYEERLGDRDYPKIHVTQLDPSTVKSYGYVAAAVIFIITFAALYITGRSNRQIWSRPIVLYEFGLVMCMMLLVGPWTNRIYPVTLFIPATLLLQSAIYKGSRIAYAALVPFVIASIIIPLVPGAKFSRWSHVIGFDFFSAFGAWLGILILLLQRPAGTDTELAEI